MNEIEKILKDNMEDYESVKRQALKFIHENKKELSKNYAYAEVCGNPVDASHFFFLIDEKKPGSDLLLEMLDYALKKYVSSEKASVTACIKGGFHLVKKTGVDYVKEESREYLEALIRYNKALMQRNTLLKSDVEPEEELMVVWEEMMAAAGAVVYQKRKAFIDEFIPVFQSYYAYISQDREEVSLAYESHAAQGDLLQLIQESRQRDRIMGYSLKGVHKDDLIMRLSEFPIKREGSQGQNKTYLIALKLAQFEFLKRTGSQTTPLVLLDDIFDKLDASRVEQIVKLVAGDNFGQIFITDTNRDHLDSEEDRWRL